MQALLFVLKFRRSQPGVPHLALGRISMFVFCLLLPVVLAPLLSIVAKAQLSWHMTVARQRETTPGLS